MNAHYYLACDLGAESGRVMLGCLSSGKLELEELHRFPNQPLPIGGSLRWDIPGLFRGIKAGMAAAAERHLEIRSISVDSWGVDYAWIGARQPLLSLPVSYRDGRSESAYAEAMKQVSKETIFAETGLQFMNINTLYQLFADHRDSPGLVQLADCFLPMADYFHYLLSGEAKAEESLASTTQVYNPSKRAWSSKLIQDFRFRAEVFPELVPSGTTLGKLLPGVCDETGLGPVAVVATCSHDTGSAVAAVPAEEGEDWAFLSSGTWSLIGVELEEPQVREEILVSNFTNEGGLGGTTRFLRNIVGLWILQECRREWEAEGHCYSYAELTRLASEAEPLRSLIDPDDARFIKPGGMPDKVLSFCSETGQAEPESVGAIVRCILESLALAYRTNLQTIERLTGRNICKLHIVGGGSKNKLLNQFAANATGRLVLAGPDEATAIGNILIQALVAGELSSREDIRSTVRNSFPITHHQPAEQNLWKAAAARFTELTVSRN